MINQIITGTSNYKTSSNQLKINRKRDSISFGICPPEILTVDCSKFIYPRKLTKVLNVVFSRPDPMPSGLLGDLTGFVVLSKIDIYKIVLLYNINPNSSVLARAVRQGHWDKKSLSELTGEIFKGLFNKN